MQYPALLIFFTLLGGGSIIAQPLYEIRQAMEFFNANKMHEGVSRSTITEADIEGSPYLNDEFIEGSVYITSKTQFVGVPLRYNIYNDQVEFRTEDGLIQALAAPEVIEKIEFGEYHLEYIPFLIGNRIRRGFFIVQEKGRSTLYIRPRIFFEGAKKPGGYQDATPARFVKKTDEYYIRIDREPAKLAGKKKDLVKIFPGHNKETEAFIKDNRINPKRSEDLQKLVKYYNSF